MSRWITVHTLFIIATLSGFGFGLPAVFVPEWVMSNYGASIQDPVGAFLTRFYGADLIANALLVWWFRNETRAASLRPVLASRAIASAIRLVVASAVLAAGIVNPWF